MANFNHGDPGIKVKAAMADNYSVKRSHTTTESVEMTAENECARSIQGQLLRVLFDLSSLYSFYSSLY